VDLFGGDGRGSLQTLSSLIRIAYDSCNYIRVQDSGQGVPDSIRNLLFHPFVSVKNMGGIGLGLTIAQHAARAHGGCLNLEESSRGKTIFVLQLPKYASECSVIE
jgi:signal transduction histidine kinase